jgi:hypothetical protein
VKKILVVLLLLGACQPPRTVPGTAATGAAEPLGAVEGFLAGVRQQDLQAMARFWGNENGSAMNVMPRDELDKRLLLMQCYLNHEGTSVMSGPRTRGDTVVYVMELQRGTQRRPSTAKVLPGPGGRWFLLEMEMIAEFCRNPPTGRD